MSDTLIDTGVLAGTRYDRSTIYESINSISAALLEQEEKRADYIVDTRMMSLADEGRTLAWDTPQGEAVGGTISEHAHGQIAARLQIPSTYYRRMRGDAPELLKANVEGWFRRQPERRMLRTMDGRIRAFMSDRYRRLDNLDLMTQAIIPVLQTTPGLHFQVASLTDEKLHLNALLPMLSRDIKPGDTVQAGVSIRNSEVGQGRLLIAPRLWRLVCRNGLLMADEGLARYHVGRRADEEAYEIYTDETIQADDTAFFLKARDAMKAALDEARFETLVESLRDAADRQPIANPVAATELLASRYDLTDGERGNVLRHLAAGGDLSQWGAINAVTAAAKDSETFDRGSELEHVGAKVAGLSDAEWMKVAAAA